MPVVEPTVSLEKLRELLAEGHETSELDYKQTLDLDTHRDLVELAKDLGAMRGEPLGGYVVVGADDHGTVTGTLTPRTAQLLDEAALRGKLSKFLSPPLTLLSAVHDVDGHECGLIYVGPAPLGFEVFEQVGEYVDDKKRNRTVFQKGDVFVRIGTSSTRWDAAAASERLERYARTQKEAWRRELREDLGAIFDAGVAGARVASGPTAALTWQLDAQTFDSAVVELLRRNDDIPLRRLLAQAPAEVARARHEGRLDDIATILDRLTCVAAITLELDREEWVARVVDALLRVYNLGIDASGFAQTTPENIQLWLDVIVRVYALGALAVRLERWPEVRELAVRKGQGHDFEYYESWLRHAQVAAARAGMTPDKQPDLALIPRAHNVVRAVECLRPDVEAEDDAVLTGLCQFDAYAALAVVAVSGSMGGGAFYTNFARFWTQRAQPAFSRVVRDPAVREVIFPRSDADLAAAIRGIDQLATKEGVSYSGWHGIDDPAVIEFLAAHPGQGA